MGLRVSDASDEEVDDEMEEASVSSDDPPSSTGNSFNLCDHFDANDCLFGGDDDDDDDVDDGMAWRPDAPSSMHQEPHVRLTQSSARTDAPADAIKVTFRHWGADGKVESGTNGESQRHGAWH